MVRWAGELSGWLRWRCGALRTGAPAMARPEAAT
jgi:hypothetical protein